MKTDQFAYLRSSASVAAAVSTSTLRVSSTRQEGVIVMCAVFAVRSAASRARHLQCSRTGGKLINNNNNKYMRTISSVGFGFVFSICY